METNQHEKFCENCVTIEKDILRDSILRYLGYTNEVGESFRPILPRFVVPSYLISGGYVLADTIDKAYKANDKQIGCGDAQNEDMKHKTVREAKIITAAADTLLWQGLASVIVPGFTINRMVALTSTIVKRSTLPSLAKRWIPTAIGLAVIPLIVHPIDEGVDYVLDHTTRPWFKRVLDDIKAKSYADKQKTR